jgi:hypothetical protein
VKATLARPARTIASSMTEPATISPSAVQPSFMLQTRAFSSTLEAKTIAATSKKTGQRIRAETPCPVRAT